MRGGSRVNSGPPPDPKALRRERPSDKDGWRTLPAKRTGASPAWPLGPDITRQAVKTVIEGTLLELQDELAAATAPKAKTALRRKIDQLKRQVTVIGMQLAAQDKAERELWRELWRTPQSNAWAELGWRRDVAQYVRHKVLGEMGSLDDAKEARQWSDRLGLNPAAMLRNRWKVAADEVSVRRTARKATSKRPASSARRRLEVVTDAAGE